MDAAMEYWTECISQAADECGLEITDEQLAVLAESAKLGHECYGMSFYAPPSTDRLAAIREEEAAKLAQLQAEFDAYRERAETAVRKSLGLFSDSRVSIGEYGDVFRLDGQYTQIQ